MYYTYDKLRVTEISWQYNGGDNSGLLFLL